MNLLMKIKLIFVLLCILNFVNCVHIQLDGLENILKRCDFSRCTKPDPRKLNVHLVPHTHDDVGWLKTVDQYYYGSKQNIQNAGVQYILDTVIQELISNPNRRFIYVETAYFKKWWLEQSHFTKEIVKELVKSGQFEFVNGGWSMPDEATTHYTSLIDQSSWGLRFLNDTFGACGRPRVTWQIDPFGHSREVANLFAQMGYDAVYFAREDYQEKFFREMKRQLEHVWMGDDSGKANSKIFAGMMQMGYGPPKGFDWDLVGGEDEPIIDNMESEEYNVPKIVEKFNRLVKTYINYYATNHIMLPMGTDFNYQSAHKWFKNMDKLIDVVNNQTNGNINVFYSTPSCYTKALHDSNRIWTSKSDDYFPYASDPHAYWTGYFTSRPSLKRMERVGNNWLQACKQLDVLSANCGRFDDKITKLREAMGMMQHHDAVAGTEKQHVANDYAKLLFKGIKECQSVIANSYLRLNKAYTSRREDIKIEDIVFCDNLNISSCHLTESGKSFQVTIYNPITTEINHIIRLPVDNRFFYEVYDSKRNIINSTLVPIPESVKKLSNNGEKQNIFELAFRVYLSPLSLQTFTIMSLTNETASSAKHAKKYRIKEEISLYNTELAIIFDSNGQIKKVSGIYGGMEFANKFCYYKAAFGDNKLMINRSSGAYIFRPEADQKSYSAGNLREAIFYKDDFNIIQEVHQTYDSFISQIIKVDPKKRHIEFEFLIGPIPINDSVGKEITIRYELDQNLFDKDFFYTDSNGRQMMRRQWNYRPTWNLSVEEPISGNYYPVTSQISTAKTRYNSRVSILPDRSQGGTSFNGTLELMVHRRLLHDDDFGVGEALNETGFDGQGLRIRAKHLLILDQYYGGPVLHHREEARELLLQPIMWFNEYSNNSNSNMTHNTNYYPSIQLMKGHLENVNLLTLERWTDNSYLIRFENIGRATTSFYLAHLFETFEILKIKEMTLAANQEKSYLKERLQFTYSNDYEVNDYDYLRYPFEINLEPNEIRTFLIWGTFQF